MFANASLVEARERAAVLALMTRRPGIKHLAGEIEERGSAMKLLLELDQPADQLFSLEGKGVTLDQMEDYILKLEDERIAVVTVLDDAYPANLARPVEQADKSLEAAGRQPLPDGLTPHSLRRTFASLLFALGEPPTYVMGQMGHTTPALTLALYAREMNRRDGERERLRALVSGERPGAAPVSSTTATGAGEVRITGIRGHRRAHDLEPAIRA